MKLSKQPIKDSKFYYEKKKFDSLELMGVSDVANYLGIERARVSTLWKRGTFPLPVGMVGGRPAWTKRNIDEHYKGVKPLGEDRGRDNSKNEGVQG